MVMRLLLLLLGVVRADVAKKPNIVLFLWYTHFFRHCSISRADSAPLLSAQRRPGLRARGLDTDEADHRALVQEGRHGRELVHPYAVSVLEEQRGLSAPERALPRSLS